MLSWIRAVEDAYKRGIFDPQQIASQTGIPLDQVNQVLRWEAFKALELQDRATEEDRRDMQYKMDQLQTTKSRSVDDLADQAEIKIQLWQPGRRYDETSVTRNSTNEQSRCTHRSSTILWVQNGNRHGKIRSKRWLDRLKTVQWWEQDDIAKSKNKTPGRLWKQHHTNKDYFDRGMNTLRMNGMAQIQQVNQKYWVASQNTVNALKQLYNDMEAQKVSLLNETMQLQQSFNGMWTQEIWILEERAKWWLGDRNKDIETYNRNIQNKPCSCKLTISRTCKPSKQHKLRKLRHEHRLHVNTMICKKYPNQARAKTITHDE